MMDVRLVNMEGVEEDSRGNVEIKDESQKLEGVSDVGEQLLPGIPNKITLDHVAPKLPWTAFHRLSLVSHGWQQAIRSRQVHDSRIRARSTQTLVAMNHGRGHAISLYSISDKSCYHLPPIPGLEAGLPLACQCSTLNGKLYVLGGFEGSSADLKNILGGCQDSSTGLTNTSDRASNKVYVLDLVGQRQWKQCASMADSRAKFGCGVVYGKIYVFGGTSSLSNVVYCGSEVYDPRSDAWSPIASMGSLGLFQQVVTTGEELLVNSDFHNPEDVSKSSDEAFTTEVYNSLKNRWICLQVDSSRTGNHSIRDVIQDSVGLFEKTLMVGGKLHTMSGVAHSMDVYNTPTNSRKLTQLFSYGVLEERDSDPTTLVLLAVVVVDDQLLGVAQWMDDNKGQMGTYLIGGQELSCQSKEIQWQ